MAVHVSIALALLGTETGGSLGFAGHQPSCKLNLRGCLKGMNGWTVMEAQKSLESQSNLNIKNNAVDITQTDFKLYYTAMGTKWHANGTKRDM